MNRRKFLQAAGIAGVASGVVATPWVAAAQAGPIAGESPPAPPVRRRGPAVFAPTAEGATVIWPVDENSIGWVEYGLEGSPAPGSIAKGDDFGFIPNGNHVLRVRLHGLARGKSYWYRTHTRPVRSDSKQVPPAVVSSETYTLRTLDPSAATTRFCIWNDTHDQPPTLALLAKHTHSEPADFLFWNGDVVNNVIQRESEIAGIYLQPRGEVELAKGPPVLFVRGNHDVRGPEANRLPGYVGYPGDLPYYSFRSGPLAAIVLDTGEDKPDNHPSFGGLVNFEELIREQAAWLAREIEQPHLKNAPYKVLFCHIPVRWKSEPLITDYQKPGSAAYDHWSRRGREAWHDSLVKWGAQIVVSGHTHQWLHLPATEKFPYAQLTGGGPGRDATGSSDLPVLIRGHADASALAFRLIDVRSTKELLTVSIAPGK